jgi:hypothetical protein
VKPTVKPTAKPYTPPVDKTKNAYGSIVKDAKRIDVDYNAYPNKMDKKILVIVVDMEYKDPQKRELTSEKGLYLSEELIEQFKKEGFEKVNFINDTASITIELAKIDAAWFTFEKEDQKILNYVFSTDPKAEKDEVKGVLIKVEAQISEKVEDEFVAANKFEGVFFKTSEGEIEILEAGIY